MRLRDENKRRIIIESAVKLFSEQPFHKVRLDDVAEAAGIGKGTVYIYFKSKEDLYYSLIYDGFADIVRELAEELSAERGDATKRISIIVNSLVKFAVRHPQLYEAMRVVAPPSGLIQWEEKRRDLLAMIERVIRDGVQSGELNDAQPELTALYFPAMVRAVMMYGPRNIEGDHLVKHITAIILKGIAKAGT